MRKATCCLEPSIAHWPILASRYVSSGFTNQVLRFDPQSGSPAGVFIDQDRIQAPWELAFHTQGLETSLFVSCMDINNRVLRFDGLTGVSKETLVPQLPIVATGLEFGPSGELFMSLGASVNLLGSSVRRYAPTHLVLIPVSLLGSDSVVSVEYSTVSSTGLNSASAGTDYISSSGKIYFAPYQTSRSILVETIDDAFSEPTETFNVNLSNSVGAIIVKGQGVATILDNDPFTKFYVVDDATTDKTYEYQASGAAVENYGLNGGNTAPRGATSTSAGTTVWVVDANKKVYLYDTSGKIVGSWTAGGLQSNALVEGIATDGKDVWLVDNQADRVYYYAGAAALTSGSPNATSSFSLNSGNKNAKDIVTDGNYLWVVNDSNTDKVFKYTVAGTCVGSWTISTSGAGSPTGITLDPANVSNIWIVDNGTDRVYQYNAAAGITSGSKSANSSFALAADNTNPQGIADPTPPNNGRQLFSAGMAPPVSSKDIDSALTQLSDDLVRSRTDRPLTFDRDVYRQNEAPFSTQRSLQPTADGASRGYNRGHTTLAQTKRDRIVASEEVFANWIKLA